MGEIRFARSWKVILEINTMTGEGMHVVTLTAEREMISRILIAVFAYCSTLLSTVLTLMLQTETISTRAQKTKLRSVASSNYAEIEQLKAPCTRYYTGP